MNAKDDALRAKDASATVMFGGLVPRLTLSAVLVEFVSSFRDALLSKPSFSLHSRFLPTSTHTLCATTTSPTISKYPIQTL